MPTSLETKTPALDALASLRAVVLSDVALQEALCDIEDFSIFAARTAEAARARGVRLEAEAVKALLYAPPRPPSIDGLAPSPGWLPAEVVQVEGGAAVAWLRFGRRRLTESFYDHDLARQRFLPFNRLFGVRTPLSDLEAWATALPALEPAGLIFHMSRCGSTLAARMLAASPANVVLSEAAPLDAVVRRADLDDDAKVAQLRAMVAALGQARNGESRLFLKLDCWHSLDLPLFRRAFPDTPWVFLYRDPVEVLVSHTRRRGIQMTPSLVPPATFGIDLPDGVPNDDYCARVLAAVCAGAARHHPAGGGRLVNYRQLPEALFTEILPHFGIAVSETEAQAMRAAALRDAKAPEQAFAPDGQDKQQAATPALRAICERRLGEVYRRLEAMRTSRS
ncbi:aspartyl beta-hydroxylase [Caulobacter sp. Root1455]|uniref:aspartyl beta-hydroxylase n=1 Tax=Caulobacter sp. Root1455 TaxID=1736465 RepID=UPI0006FDFC20|nr:aspartyl beta-hydroxylase [Caulobacter sp. Root1455]KQY92588.1 aspartyl beta-hydroxylase [Caulobacter sp. Root1455]